MVVVVLVALYLLSLFLSAFVSSPCIDLSWLGVDDLKIHRWM